MKKDQGITLIALIITIIVLLLLAGVVLNMIIGENGILTKANNSKNKTEISQYQEELNISMLETQTEYAKEGKKLELKNIKESNFKEIVKRNWNTEEIEFPTSESETELTGKYKGYNFKINDKLQITIE